MRLVFIRHGESMGNVDHTEYSRTPDWRVELTPKGREQARMVGAWLRENAPPFDAFYCSQYVRTKETAAEMGLPNASWHADLMLSLIHI